MSHPENSYKGHDWIKSTTWLSSAPDTTPILDVIKKLIDLDLKIAVANASSPETAKSAVREGAEIVVQFMRYVRHIPNTVPVSDGFILDVCTEIIVTLIQQQKELGTKLGLSSDEAIKLMTHTADQVAGATQ